MIDLVPVRTFKLLKLGKRYIHKKDRMKRLLYFLLVKFLLLYDMKIYVNNLLVQIDTFATSSYTPTYTSIAIYFISTVDTITNMDTHTNFLIHFR
jgi:polyferredoxin